jgi:putative chitinase
MNEEPLRDSVIKKYIGDNTKIPLASRMIALMDNEKWSSYAQANILHQVQLESGGKPIPENLNYRPSIIVQKFGNRPYFKGMTASQKLKAAEGLVTQGKEAIGNAIYGGILGNVNSGDGFKYRGRGFIQLTGKANYEEIGKAIGVDLINNPDLLLTDENISQRASIAFLKREQKNRKLNYDDMSQVSRAINSGESVSVRMQKAKKQGIELLTPAEVNAFRPAENQENLTNFRENKISVETYMERRGF